MQVMITLYSAQKKKLNGPKFAKYFFPVERSKFFLALLYYGRSSKPTGNEAELQYQYSFGKKNCLTIIGEKLFATPGPLSFFFWPL